MLGMRINWVEALSAQPGFEIVAVLFASYVCSAMAMRHFNHAGLVMSMPVASAARKALNPMASAYVERAGLLYSWGLRFFLMVAPVVVGIVNAWAMPLMTLLLIAVLAYFDRPHHGPEFVAPSSPI